MTALATVRQLLKDVDPADRDPADRDPGEYDPTEVHNLTATDVYHPSFEPASPAVLPSPTDEGREKLRQILDLARLAEKLDRRQAEKRVRISTGWRDTPEAFRRLVARSAALPDDVVGKLDRDLSEAEKVAIRAAAKRLRDRADALFAI